MAWIDSNNLVSLLNINSQEYKLKDAEARAAIDVLNSDATVTGSVSYKIAQSQSTIQNTINNVAAVATANALAIETLNSNSTTTGSVDYKIAQAQDTLQDNIDGVAAVATANALAIDTLNADSTTNGSVDKKILTAIQALDKSDSATTGQFVTAVSEEDGVITVSRDAVNAQYVQFSATGADATSELTSTTVDKALVELEKAINAGGTGSVVKVYKNNVEVNTISADGSDYVIKQGNDTVATLNIAADMVVTSGELYTADGTETKASDSTSYGLTAGEKYLKLTIDNQDDDIYISVHDLVDVYTSGSTASDKVQIAVSNTGEITASVKTGSIEKTDLVSGVQTSLGLADTSVQTVNGLAPTASGAVVLDATNIKMSDGTTTIEAAIASAADSSDLDTLEGRVDDLEDAIATANASIATASANITANTNAINTASGSIAALETRVDALEDLVDTISYDQTTEKLTITTAHAAS